MSKVNYHARLKLSCKIQLLKIVIEKGAHLEK